MRPIPASPFPEVNGGKPAIAARGTRSPSGACSALPFRAGGPGGIGLALLLCACPPSAGAPDGGAGDGGGSIEPLPGYAALVFRVDDKANRSYASGQLFWKGTFQVADLACAAASPPTRCNEVAGLPAATRGRIVFYDPAWGGVGDGEPGPWPQLFDDGPIAAGGHEAPGASAGDRVHSVEAWTKVDQDTTFEYGLANEDYNWIWSGPNGSTRVAAGSTDVVEVPTYSIAAWGPIDFKLNFECAGAPASFKAGFPSPCNGSNLKVFVKGTMNSWKPLAMADDGNRGDATANDGVFTYVQSKNLGPHDGRLPDLPGLSLGQHVQFTLVFFDERGSEYKAAGKGVADGVAAATNYDSARPAEFLSESVVLEKESRGSAQNTAIVVGFETAANAPQIQFVDPDRGNAADVICVRGINVAGGAVTFGAAVANAAPRCTDLAQTPPSDTALPVVAPAGTPGTSVDVRVKTANGEHVAPLGFTYLQGSGPTITKLMPAQGSTSGGEAVQIIGTDLDKVVRATFDAASASCVTPPVSASRVDCTTPPHAAGPVTVTVYTSESRTAALPNGFAYVAPAPPQVSSVNPTAGPTSAGAWVTLFGSNLGSAIGVKFGGANAGSVDAAPAGNEILATAPSGSGAADVEVTTSAGTGRLAGGYTFSATPPLRVGWCRLQWPPTLSTPPGQATAKIYGWVYQAGSTPGVGQGPGIEGQVGVGPAGTDPDAAAWTWAASAYNVVSGDKDGLVPGDKANDEYEATVSAPTIPGTYDFAFRFRPSGDAWRYCDRDGSDNGYSPRQAGVLTVQ